MSEEENQPKSTSAVDYNTLFDEITTMDDSNVPSVASPVYAAIEGNDKSTEMENMQPNVGNLEPNVETELNNNIVYLEYNPSNEDQEMKKNINMLSIKVDQLQRDVSTLIGQNKLVLEMMTDFFKRTPIPSSFEAVINIDTKEKLDVLEAKLNEEHFFENMVHNSMQ